VEEQDCAADSEGDGEPPSCAGRPERRQRAPAEDEHRRNDDVREDAANQHRRGIRHVAGSAHHVREDVEHANRNRTAEGDRGIVERGLEHGSPATHPAVDQRPDRQHHSREHDCHAERERKSVRSEVVRPLARSRSQGARDGGGNRPAHAAGRYVLHEHDEGKHERHAGERVRAKAAQKQPVESDEAGDRRQVEDIGRRQAQQRGENRRLEQHPGARGGGARGRCGLVQRGV
jgi:hypothetical protein